MERNRDAKPALHLEIDGVPLNTEYVAVHEQSEPFPGGCRYSLTFLGSHVEVRLLKAIDNYRRKRVSSSARRFNEEAFTTIVVSNGDVAHTLFFELKVMFHECVRNGSRPLYVLNSIDLMEISAGRVMICGVCSPFVQH